MSPELGNIRHSFSSVSRELLKILKTALHTPGGGGGVRQGQMDFDTSHYLASQWLPGNHCANPNNKALLRKALCLSVCKDAQSKRNWRRGALNFIANWIWNLKIQV